MKRKETRRKKLQRKSKTKKQECHLLKKIDTLPVELVHEIKNYLPLKMQNRITPLKNRTDIFDLMRAYHWLNFHLYFYEYFERIDLKYSMKIKKYFDFIKNTKYVQYKKQIYERQDKSVHKKIRELVETDVQFFFYTRENRVREILQRSLLIKPQDYIEEIVQTI